MSSDSFIARYSVLPSEIGASPAFERTVDGQGDGVLVAIEFNGQVKAVALPPGTFGYCSGVLTYATPSPNVVCISVSGRAYLVRCMDDFKVEELDTVAACAFVPFPELSILVVVDLTRVIGIGPRGVLWVSEELSDDQITGAKRSGLQLTLEAYSATEGCWSTILIDPGSGRKTAGGTAK